MKKILIVSAVFPPEPVVSAKLSFDIAKALAIDSVVTVLSPRPSRPSGFQFTTSIKSNVFNHITLNSYICPSSKLIGRFRESYSFGKLCYQYIANNHENIDIIYANTWPLFGQYFAIKTALKYNKPIVVHVQDIYPESLMFKIPKLRRFINFALLPIDKYILRNANKIIAISEHMKTYLSQTRNINNEMISVVQNWQDETAFIQYNAKLNKKTDQNNPFTFMYLGNIGPVAGVELLIDAYIKAKLLNCRLIIAGSGSMKETLYAKTKEQKIDTIEFWSVPEGKVPEIQDQADVMLLPIRKGAAGSSIPSKLPAYMFSKKPIIACVDENSDTSNSIISAQCGWVLPPNEQNNLVRTMKMVAELSKEELQVKGINGFEYAMKHFSKKENLEKLIGIINISISV